MLFLKYLLRLLLGHDPLIQLLKKQCISPGLWLKDLGSVLRPIFYPKSLLCLGGISVPPASAHGSLCSAFPGFTLNSSDH